MALDIGIGYGGSCMPVPTEPQLALNSDGYYWFLHPLLERLRTETGQYIDLYGNASFSGEDLAALDNMLTEARKLTFAQPDEWEVQVGTQIIPVRRELYEPVTRRQILDLLDNWCSIVQRARKLGRPVVCFGD